ncbi:MAG: O-methyltransferase [Isosphaeraceae bacterium]
MAVLFSPRVAGVLDRLFAEAERGDPLVWEKVQAEKARRGGSVDEAELGDLLGEAFMPVDRPSGRFLYNLVRAQGSRTVVEFGMSFGISTIHLAAAVRDNGAGRVVTTELDAGKVRRATEHLDQAGLLDVVEVRHGDALETLRDLGSPVDLVFLDGWKLLYLPVLRLLEPKLRAGAAVVADDLALFPDQLRGYLEYVRDPSHGYSSVEVPIGDSFELSVRTP